ncbi:VanZ family protein [Anaerostipes sp.]|uniref:VanZ family protein n=1 Tax=Anaerostipes sp. TaxID=1872530 RepID=UPI0025C04CB1|nr:VanZ family protein [Anaerostipes sp.]MBS7007259.1 VanZ family protein [Anaerostipes sp.]
MKNKKLWRSVYWLLTALMMTGIFLFSAKTASTSEQMSMGVTRFLTKYIGMNHVLSVMDHYVRKTAHFMEYALLAVLVYNALKIDITKKLYLFSAAQFICSFYAATDELHQYFVPGRSCQLKDVLIDSCGALTGICLCFLFSALTRKIRRKPEKKWH